MLANRSTKYLIPFWKQTPTTSTDHASKQKTLNRLYIYSATDHVNLKLAHPHRLANCRFHPHDLVLVQRQVKNATKTHASLSLASVLQAFISLHIF
jgi:hypothetical protein